MLSFYKPFQPASVVFASAVPSRQTELDWAIMPSSCPFFGPDPRLRWKERLDSDLVAESVLDLAESVLIYSLQPKLNFVKLKPPRTSKPIHIHVQNYAGTQILDDLMLEYSNDMGLMIVPPTRSSAGRLGTEVEGQVWQMDTV